MQKKNTQENLQAIEYIQAAKCNFQGSKTLLHIKELKFGRFYEKTILPSPTFLTSKYHLTLDRSCGVSQIKQISSEEQWTTLVKVGYLHIHINCDSPYLPLIKRFPG